MDEAEIAFIKPAKELAEVADTCVKQDTTTKSNPSNSASANKKSIYIAFLAFVLNFLSAQVIWAL